MEKSIGRQFESKELRLALLTNRKFYLSGRLDFGKNGIPKEAEKIILGSLTAAEDENSFAVCATDAAALVGAKLYGKPVERTEPAEESFRNGFAFLLDANEPFRTDGGVMFKNASDFRMTFVGMAPDGSDDFASASAEPGETVRFDHGWILDSAVTRRKGFVRAVLPTLSVTDVSAEGPFRLKSRHWDRIEAAEAFLPVYGEAELRRAPAFDVKLPLGAAIEAYAGPDGTRWASPRNGVKTIETVRELELVEMENACERDDESRADFEMVSKLAEAAKENGFGIRYEERSRMPFMFGADELACFGNRVYCRLP